MNYEEMSDFEINAAVTCIVHNCQGWEFNWTNSCFFHCGVDGSGYFSQSIINYCNNPSDAWPIIVENGISLVWMNAEVSYYEAHGINEEIWDEDWQSQHPNALRAAMICFLKMKDAEK